MRPREDLAEYAWEVFVSAGRLSSPIYLREAVIGGAH